jgi:hypothetical protein
MGQRCVAPAFVSPATISYAATGIILTIVVKSKGKLQQATPGKTWG